MRGVRRLRIIGIDPGLTGALALFVPPVNAPAAMGALRIEDVPTFALPKSKAGKTVLKKHVDLMALGRLIDDLVGTSQPVVFIEQVSAMPGQGVASTFDFGRTTGILLGATAAHLLRIEQVTPASWKKALKVPASKDGARARASQIWPQHAATWARAKDDGRAEAALIAFYGWQVLKGES